MTMNIAMVESYLKEQYYEGQDIGQGMTCFLHFKTIAVKAVKKSIEDGHLFGLTLENSDEELYVNYVKSCSESSLFSEGEFRSTGDECRYWKDKSEIWYSWFNSNHWCRKNCKSKKTCAAYDREG